MRPWAGNELCPINPTFALRGLLAHDKSFEMSTSNRKDSNRICTPIKRHIVRVKRNGKLLERLFTWFKSSSLSRCDSLGLKQFWHLLLLKMLAWNFRQGLSLSDMVDWGSDTRWEKRRRLILKVRVWGGKKSVLTAKTDASCWCTLSRTKLFNSAQFTCPEVTWGSA